MATATERAALGAEEGRREGKGPAGRAADAAKAAATGRGDHPGVASLDNGDNILVADRGLLDHHHHSHNGGMLGHTEEEMAKLRTRTLVTHEGEAYCPNPNIRDLVSPTVPCKIRLA